MSNIILPIKSSKNSGLNTLNDALSAVGIAGQPHTGVYLPLNDLKRDDMTLVKNTVIELINNNKLTANDLMLGKAHITIITHTTTFANDIDNICYCSKAILDALQSIRVEINYDDNTLTYIDFLDPHGSIKKSSMPGIPFLSNDNQNGVLSLQVISGKRSPDYSYIDFTYTTNETEYMSIQTKTNDIIKRAHAL